MEIAVSSRRRDARNLNLVEPSSINNHAERWLAVEGQFVGFGAGPARRFDPPYGPTTTGLLRGASYGCFGSRTWRAPHSNKDSTVWQRRFTALGSTRSS